jgi:exodeoxyribonuclease V gamma subunit
VILCKDEAWRIAPVEKARDILASLFCLYWQGLTAPLKLFPNTSWHYAQQVHLKKRNREEGMQSARRIWVGDDRNPGEGSDTAYRLCFQAADPIDEEFRNNTEKIFAPLMEHMTKI